MAECEECEVGLGGTREEIFQLRYAFINNETWPAACERVAQAVSSAEVKDREQWNVKFREILENFLFLPGGRILRNAGRQRPMMLNCFVLDVNDNRESIGKLLNNAFVVSGSGGGIGINWSNLRPKGDPILGVGGVSSGAVSFMQALDSVAATVESGGQRRAALIAILNVTHPEIFDFINAKIKENVLTHFNISVGITNDFIKAVKKDRPWDLTFGNKTYRTVPAKKLWDLIIDNAWKHAEPGIVNLDNLQKYNNLWYCEELRATNPCITGETLIAVADGRKGVSIKQLAKEKKDVPVYSWDGYTVTIKMGRNFRQTGEKVHVCKVELDDGSFFTATVDHKLLQLDGKYVRVADSLGSRIIPFNRVYDKTGTCIGRGEKESWQIYRHFNDYQGDIYPKYNIHHINGNKYDNKPENLRLISHSDHAAMNMMGEDNPVNKFPEKNIFNNSDWQQMMRERNHIGKKRSRETCKRISLSKRGLLNHEIVGLSYQGKADVYNCTVDDFHNFAIITAENVDARSNKKDTGIFIRNCGEVPLAESQSCCLGSINLSEMVQTDSSGVDWKKLRETVRTAVRFLDDVLDVTHYPLKKIELETRATRRIGLGVMGLHYLLLKLGLKNYGTEESLEFMDELFSKFRDYAYIASIELAAEKGVFEKYDGPQYLEGEFIRELPRRILTRLRRDGMRNATVLTMPPTGTTAMIAGVSSGVEPIFAPMYKRKFRTPDSDGKGRYKENLEVDPLYQAFIEADKDTSHFIGAYDIDPAEHMAVQSTSQKYIDSSISKTILLSKNYPKEKLSKLLLEYGPQIKGTTIYREGCRGTEILSPVDHTRYSKEEILQLGNQQRSCKL